MNRMYLPTPFRKIIVPVIYGCSEDTAISAAQVVAGGGTISLLGLVKVETGQSLSKAAQSVRLVRETLKNLQKDDERIRILTRVIASYSPWEELLRILSVEKPDLCFLHWPCYIDALGISADEALAKPPCSLVLVRAPFPKSPRNLLAPLRGSPNAELVLRLALAISGNLGTSITSLHLSPPGSYGDYDKPYRGIAKIIQNLPEIQHVEMETRNPGDVILQQANLYDLVILGAYSYTEGQSHPLGNVAIRLLEDSPAGVLIARVNRPKLGTTGSSDIGSSAISVLVDKWFAENTYHADEFSDLEQLLSLKLQQNLTISLALPALNEQATIANVINTLKKGLMDDIPLLDEMVLVDSNSTDRTREIAASLGIPVFVHQEILPQYGERSGKGEALWKSLFVTNGDILLWIDTDITNIHPRFVTGLLGPLLSRPRIQFIKGFYRRPIKVGSTIQAGGGGRVTELTARPLLNLFYPELSGIIQPLSGEYGGRRSALEKLVFYSGYGVEIGLLTDAFDKLGLKSIAQVDLVERIHHNQPLESLSKMSFAIIQAVIQRLEQRHQMTILQDYNKTMKLIRHTTNSLFLDVVEIAEQYRPPMIEIPEYRQRQSTWHA